MNDQNFYHETCYSILLGKSTASHIILSKEVLHLGDILLRTDDDKDVLLIERKTFSDLLASKFFNPPPSQKINTNYTALVYKIKNSKFKLICRDSTQRPRMDSNKKFLPSPTTA